MGIGRVEKSRRWIVAESTAVEYIAEIVLQVGTAALAPASTS